MNKYFFVAFITRADITDFSLKLGQQSSRFFLSKLNPFASKRVAGHWDHFRMPPVNWWNIPMVRRRWNEKITGSAELDYIPYLHKKYFKRNDLRMLSIGCGTGSQELQFAKLNCFSQIDAFDISPASIATANQRAKDEGVFINFFAADFWEYKPAKPYDVILFFSSLHHVKHVHQALQQVKRWMKQDAILIIHEYTGPDRIQFTQAQLQEVNRLLAALPETHRIYWGSSKIKRRQYAPGLLRMLLTDPSEAVDAESIIPSLQQLFHTTELKPYGGNILQPLLKGISHHFSEESEENKKLLQYLFDAEDTFLQNHLSDFHFGVFQI